MAAMDPARVSIQPTSHESVIGPDMSARQSLRIPAPRGPRPAPGINPSAGGAIDPPRP